MRGTACNPIVVFFLFPENTYPLNFAICIALILDPKCAVNKSLLLIIKININFHVCLILGKTNMFRYNDPLEAADMRKTMTENSRKVILNVLK